MALMAPVHYLPDHLYIKRVHQQNLTGSGSATSDYSKFRDKWDFYHSSDSSINKRIAKALQYYYVYHAPLRHFKFAMLTAKEILKTPKRGNIKWFFECMGHGVADFVF